MMSVLNKICLHWTGGANFPCNKDLEAYHFCIDKLGKIYQGEYLPEDNLNCNDEKYAKHCGGGNTGCIGLSLCGMAGFNLADLWTRYPLYQKQIEAFCCMAGYLTNKYKIDVCKETVFTHYEFGQSHPKTSSYGKIDFTYLPYLPNLQKERIGDYLRNKIQWYQIQQKKGK